MTYKRYLIEGNLSGEAVVCEIGFQENHYIILDQSWFHPQGGGQKSDVGYINEYRVIHVANVNNELRHFIDSSEAPTVKIGQRVNLEVDESLRRQSERLHTAGHLIAAVSEYNFSDLKAVGGHHWKGQSRVEFAGENLPESEQFQQFLVKHVKNSIDENLSVEIVFDDEAKRSIAIGDYPKVGCGGTHVSRLSELTNLKIIKVKKKKDKLRVSYDI